VIAVAAMIAMAEPVATPITLGSSVEVEAKALGDQRAINVVLPDDYDANSTRSYPVVYVIDGGVDQDLIHIAGTAKLGAMWGRNQDVILVGIQTKQRRRELTGKTSDPELLKKYPESGQSALFRQFIRDQVKPLVAANYRTDGKDAVIGESLAGLFIVETYLVEPELFGGYGAVSPSLWWDKEALSKAAAQRIGPRQSGHPLYLTTANEDLVSAVDRLFTAIKTASDWCLAPRRDLTHATIYHTVSPTVLQYLMPPSQPPAPEFGFEVKCSPKS
jgi:predicted alpha/beta superfamily hydrolase